VIAFGTLGRYFGRRFLGAVMVVFFCCVGLIALVDFLELTRRFGDRPNASFVSIAQLVMLRLPAFTEQLLPFAVLIGAMGTFLTFSRRLEFVIARSAGLSVWQFTGSAAVIALAIGVLAVTVYNPRSRPINWRPRCSMTARACSSGIGKACGFASRAWTANRSSTLRRYRMADGG
jgi:hypothetical protein